jgi:hypothetical protein
MASRIASAQKAHERVVLEHDDHVIGFACGHVFNRLPSFKWSAETSAAPSRAGGGRKTPNVSDSDHLGYRRSSRHHPPTRPAALFIDPSGLSLAPPRRMETRQLPRRRMDTTRSARPRRPGWTAWPNHLIAKLIGAHAKRGSTGAVGRDRRYSRSPW